MSTYLWRAFCRLAPFGIAGAIVLLGACSTTPTTVPVPTTSPTRSPTATTVSVQATAVPNLPTLLPTVVSVAPTATPVVSPVISVSPTATVVPPTPEPVTPTPAMVSPTAAPLTGTVRETLRVRSGPGTDFSVLGKLARDTQVTLLARSQDAKWFQIDYPSGPDGRGWVSVDFVAVHGSAGDLAIAQTEPPPPTAAPRAPTAAPSQSSSALSGAALELFNRTNALRGQLGLALYEWSEQLASSALRHSQDMANSGRIEHTGSDNSTAAQRVADTHYDAKQVGENIYMGSSLDDAWDFWSQDPPHRANLVHGGYTQVGIGTSVSGPGTYYTMDLAEPAPNLCAPIPDNIPYGTLQITSAPTDRPAEAHPDINLGMRGSVIVNAPKKFIEVPGATDTAAPQLRWLFADRRLPAITRNSRVYAWDWNKGAPGPLIDDPPVTLAGVKTAPGEPLYTPQAGTTLGDGYVAFVLYATPNRLTLKYTRDDNVVDGYTLHVENVCVEPSLLALYQQMNAAKRRSLPALRPGQPFGRALGSEIGVVVRDKGTFMDPRSLKDWWVGK